ncbi:186L [Invertebrate iridescent virus 6]|uniref:186L n=1 Tax=Invertebrate iridescent virus 6 TaxID=176652 RepID=Q91FY0_IIV6|nr:186L [Invertebrate iridescent virus 6]AAK82052.1 186L [Invertebrate iridescent virus 6]QMS79564.1 hypothetical protein IIV6-T1_186 [Invertebrate iridescent virus 6]
MPVNILRHSILKNFHNIYYIFIVIKIIRPIIWITINFFFQINIY